jgi:Protein of unknown function (DUF3168)
MMSEPDESAAEALIRAARARLAGLNGLNGAYDGRPVQAACPYAIVEIAGEADWSHKSGAGRELRLAVTVRDAGESPARLRRLMRRAEGALAGIGADLGGWRLVSFVFLRSRMLRSEGAAIAGATEWRARVLET